MNRLFIYLTIVLGLSCSGNTSNKQVSNDDILLAEIKDKSLFLSEIPKFNFVGLEAKDSITFLKNYTKNWIKDQVIVLKAQDVLPSLEEINSETEKYKTDLIKAAYQKKALQSVDIELTEEELVSYYEKHKEYFILDEDYSEIKYIILPRNTSNLQQIKKSIKENTPSNFIESYCSANKNKCHLKTSVLKKQTYLTENLKMASNLISIGNAFKYHYIDDDNVLIYKIISTKKKGETAPLNLVKNEVSRMCLHNKKQEHLLEIEEKSYQKAKNDKIFENYIN